MATSMREEIKVGDLTIRFLVEGGESAGSVVPEVETVATTWSPAAVAPGIATKMARRVTRATKVKRSCVCPSFTPTLLAPRQARGRRARCPRATDAHHSEVISSRESPSFSLKGATAPRRKHH